MKTVYVFLADGFEEIEALAPVDLMRRADLQVVTVGVTGKTVTGGHGVPVVADMDGAGFVLPQDAAMVVLPGGGVGTQNLAQSAMVADVLREASARGLHIAAICAAPTVLDREGLLQGKKATVFPTMQSELKGAQEVTGAAAEVDGTIITGRSAGAALPFAHALITALAGTAKADEVLQSVYPGV